MKFNLIISMFLVVSLIGCTKQVAENKTETKVETTVATTQPQTQVQTAPAQLTGDPLKDEIYWPIGKFGYHEPPENIRNYTILGDTYDDIYRISIHSEQYGDLEIEYYTDSNQRTIYTKGGGNKDQLLITHKNVTNAELLEDLQMGDLIARNFGK